MWELVLVSHSWCCEFSTPLAKAGAEFQTINNGCYLPRTNLFDCPHYECGSCFTDFFCDSHVPTFSIYHSKFKIYHVPSPLCHFTFVSIKWSRFNYLRQMVSVGPFTPYLLTYIYMYVHLFPSNYLCSWLLLSTVVSYGKGSMWCGCVLTGFLVQQVFSFFHLFSSLFLFSMFSFLPWMIASRSSAGPEEIG